MKILVYGINYYPELTGIGKYTGEMCEWLAAKGHQVEVITAMPYYPEWKIRADYAGKKHFTEIIKGVKVRRTPLYVPTEITGKSRIRQEISFIFKSLPHWIPAMFRSYDVVIGICPPLQTGVFPLLYKFFRRKPLVFHVQDLQVDAARDLGMLKNKFFLNLLLGIEKYIIKKASGVSSISPGMKRKILAKGGLENNYIDLPNWSDTEFVRPISKECSMRKEFGYGKEDKVILYSGNMGSKQGLEVVLEVAEQFSGRKDVHFLMAGEGAGKKALKEAAARKGLQNMQFVGLQPYEKLPEFLAVADLHLVVQKKAASDLVLPSKLMSILSAGGVPVVTALPGTSLYDLVRDRSLGFIAEPESETALFEAVSKALEEDLSVYRKNARRYAEEELHISKILSNFERTLKDTFYVK
ncbi:WcaI family glycosyltransferase [Cytophagaceae bacterium ABcell3]|nr:WcaI family glycosyltransferase [Cytophagaceae bacterium ABcell3]